MTDCSPHPRLVLIGVAALLVRRDAGASNRRASSMHRVDGARSPSSGSKGRFRAPHCTQPLGPPRRETGSQFPNSASWHVDSGPVHQRARTEHQCNHSTLTGFCQVSAEYLAVGQQRRRADRFASKRVHPYLVTLAPGRSLPSASTYAPYARAHDSLAF